MHKTFINKKISKNIKVIIPGLLLISSLLTFTLGCDLKNGPIKIPETNTNTSSDTTSETEPQPIQTPPFHKEFSGSTALVLGPFNLPKGLYKITVKTSGFFQLFNATNNDETIFNLFEGEGDGAETVFRSSGGDYIFNAYSGNYGAQTIYQPSASIMLFRTDNISEAYRVTFEKLQ